MIAVSVRNGFSIKRILFIYSYPEKGGSAKLLLVENKGNGCEELRVGKFLYS